MLHSAQELLLLKIEAVLMHACMHACMLCVATQHYLHTSDDCPYLIVII